MMRVIGFCFSMWILCGPIGAEVLPSWNEGAAKEAILQFVKEVTDKENASYIPPKDRIAAFDEDGTLWVEQPFYTQIFYAIDSIKSQGLEHLDLKNNEPFKSIIAGDSEALKSLSSKDIEKIIVATHTGITVDAFRKDVSDWLEKAVHPRFKRPFTELVYQPMLEVIRFLRDNEFDVYIVSGGGQEFIRAFSEKVYGIPPSHVIGTAGKMKYEYREGNPVLVKLPEILFVDDKAGKPEGINLIIGARPVVAFGNSIGDREMLEWTQKGEGKSLELLIHHDDAEREYAYGPNSKIGTFSESLMEEAKKLGWVVVSMKNDWKVIFGNQ